MNPLEAVKLPPAKLPEVQGAEPARLETLTSPEGNVLRYIEFLSRPPARAPRGLIKGLLGLKEVELKSLCEELCKVPDRVYNAMWSYADVLERLPVKAQALKQLEMLRCLKGLDANNKAANTFLYFIDVARLSRASGNIQLVQMVAELSPGSVLYQFRQGDYDWLKKRYSRKEPGVSAWDKVLLTLWKSDPVETRGYFHPPEKIYTDQETFDQVLCKLLKAEGIDRAMKFIANRESFLDSKSQGGGHARGVRERLRCLGQALGTVLEDSSLQGHLRDRFSLARNLINRGIIVDGSLVDILGRYYDKTRKLLCGILESCGTQYGKSILRAVESTFADSGELDNHQVQVLQAIVATGFRGVSGETLKLFESRYKESAVRAELLVHRWKRAAKAFMSTESLPTAIKKDPVYTELLAVAYRPGVHYFDMETIKKFAKEAVDRQEHLKGYVYPKDGWSFQAQESSCKQGEEENGKTSQGQTPEIAACLKAMEHPQEADLLRTGLLLLKGGDGSVERSTLVAKALKEYFPEEFSQAVKVIGSREMAGKCEIIRTLIADHLEEAFDRCAADLSGQVVLGDKLNDQVGRILKLSPGSAVTKNDVEDALAYKFYAHTREIRRQACRHARTDGEEATGNIKLLLTKCDHSFFSRGAAALCTVEDTWSWNNPDYLQMNMVAPSEGRVYGNVQLHVFKDPEGKKGILPRINVCSAFGRSIEPYVDWILSVVRQFARENKLVPYLPVSESPALCNIASNDWRIRERMELYHGKGHNVKLQFVENHKYDADRIFRMRSKRRGAE